MLENGLPTDSRLKGKSTVTILLAPWRLSPASTCTTCTDLGDTSSPQPRAFSATSRILKRETLRSYEAEENSPAGAERTFADNAGCPPLPPALHHPPSLSFSPARGHSSLLRALAVDINCKRNAIRFLLHKPGVLTPSLGHVLQIQSSVRRVREGSFPSAQNFLC